MGLKREATGMALAGCLVAIFNVVIWVAGIVGVVYGVMWCLRHFSII